MTMTTSAAGRAALTQREGVRLTAYKDVKGLLTIGVGHFNATPPKVFPGMKITAAQADAILAADLKVFEDALNDLIKVPVSQAQWDSLISLAFNIGIAGFTGSTVLRKLNQQDYRAAADAFLMWEKPAVLKARREAERAQFLTPEPSRNWIRDVLEAL